MDQIIQVFYHSSIVNYLVVASTSIWAYDYLDSLSYEIEFVWQSRWSAVKVIYLVARLVAVIHLIFSILYLLGFSFSASLCQKLVYTGTATGVLNAMLAEAVIYIHIYAFSHQDRIVKWYLIVQFILLTGTAIAMMTLVFTKFVFSLDALPFLGCIPDVNPLATRLLGYGVVGPLISQAIVISIAMVIVTQKYRGLRSAVLNALLRDGLIYPVCILSCSIGIIVLTHVFFNTPLQRLLVTPYSVVANMCAARLVLHLRQTHHATMNAGNNTMAGPSFPTGFKSTGPGKMRFAARPSHSTSMSVSESEYYGQSSQWSRGDYVMSHGTIDADPQLQRGASTSRKYGLKGWLQSYAGREDEAVIM